MLGAKVVVVEKRDRYSRLDYSDFFSLFFKYFVLVVVNLYFRVFLDEFLNVK